jgi:chromate transporter
MGAMPARVPMKPSRSEVASYFLRLGATAFGGPAAHIAMMEEETVRRRGWLSREEFLDMLGAVNLIPGPNSTEMAIFIGYRLLGWPGIALGGFCFILPAAAITSAFAWAYARFGALPQAAGLLYGVKPVIIAVVAQALWGLGRTAVKSWTLAVVAAAAAAWSLLGINVLVILLSAGAACVLASRARSAPLFSAAPFALGKLFAVFFKVGAVLYGSGYVLLAFLRADLVERLGWLTPAQLLDAVAAGQFTPGPVFTTATFIGYLLGGLPGAAVATIGIFLPSFAFIAASGPLIPLLRRSSSAGAFLDGVNAASLALMAVVTLQLARSAVIDAPTGLLAAASAVLLIRFRVNSAWLVLGGGALGLLSKAFA